uniref:Uncharacterized protein n=1 Tax=Anguilla anguilla TaxID=7936 RepID=A0A0E9P769_ANGAN
MTVNRERAPNLILFVCFTKCAFSTENEDV